MNNPNGKRLLKIIVPVVLLVIIAGLWYVKNNEEKDASQQQVTVENSDFALSVTESLDLEQLKSYGLPILIEFGADYCAPCREMEPIIEELNAELQGKAIVRFVDVGTYPDFADGYPVSVIPTQLLIDASGNPYMPDSDVAGLNYYSLKDTGEHVYTTHEGTISKDQLISILQEMGMQ